MYQAPSKPNGRHHRHAQPATPLLAPVPLEFIAENEVSATAERAHQQSATRSAPRHEAPKSTGKTIAIALLSCTTALAVAWAGAASLALADNVGRAPTARMVPTITITAETTVTARPKPSKSAKSSPSPVAVEDGTWIVGEDIPAGRYKAAGIVSDDCYWSITTSGTNGGDIVQNDIPGGGRPAVVLRKGHDFNTRDCGEWVKQ